MPARAALLLAVALLSLTIPAFGLSCQSLSSANVTLTGPARNPSACTAAAAALNANRQLLANGVSFKRRFTCASCNPLPLANGTTNTGSSLACLATITAVLSPLSLAQWYANAWAVPTGGHYVTSNLQRRIVRTNPTCKNQGPDCKDQDLLPQALATSLLGDCLAITTYVDSCGGRASSPYNCSGANTTNSSPTLLPQSDPTSTPVPAPAAPACSLSINSISRNASTCRDYLVQLSSDPDYVTGLAVLPKFTGCTCGTGNPGFPNGCSVRLTGAFASQADLLQFYANVRAIPYSTTTGRLLDLPPSRGTLAGIPSTPGNAGVDFFQGQHAMVGLDVVCGATVGYQDTCGSQGRQPTHWDCASPPPSPSVLSPPLAAAPAATAPCTLTISAPTTSLSRCNAYAAELSSSPDYVAGVQQPPVFSGCSCTGNYGTCYVQLTGTFSSQADLLQFYANAGAYPNNNSTHEPFDLPPSKGSLPRYPGTDSFQAVGGRVSNGLGFVCGQSIYYQDTCGGIGVQPMHGDCLMPPWPPSPLAPPSPPSPPPSPPSPPIDLNAQPACTLTLVAPTTSLAACRALMVQLVQNANFSSGLSRPSRFTGCNACRTGSEAGGNCLVMLQGGFYTPADLLQFYSNAGALPISNTTSQLLDLPAPKGPAPVGTHYEDLLQNQVYQSLGAGCGPMVSYADTCGGLTSLPLYSPSCTPPVIAPSPSPSPSPRPSSPPLLGLAACVLTVTAPTNSLAACQTYRASLLQNSDLSAGLTTPPGFSGCGPCSSGTEELGTCLTTIIGRFRSQADLLQFYSNVGALPVAQSDRQPLALPPSKSASVPTGLPYDMLQIAAVEGMGQGCGPPLMYQDSCGGIIDKPLVVECGWAFPPGKH